MRAKLIISKVIDAICIVIIAVAVFILVSVFFTKSGQVPSIAGFSFFRVVSGSMEPELETDSLIVVKKTDPSLIKEGDIISFYSNANEISGAVNTHRVVSITKENDTLYFETKGDANVISDKELTNEGNVIGVVVAKSAFLGTLTRIISNPIVFFPLIVVPLFVLIIVNLVTSIKNTKQIMKEEEEQAVKEAIAEYKRKKATETKEKKDK